MAACCWAGTQWGLVVSKAQGHVVKEHLEESAGCLAGCWSRGGVRVNLQRKMNDSPPATEVLCQEAQEPHRPSQRTGDTQGCVPGPRPGSQALCPRFNQLLGVLTLLPPPWPLGFALETPASISLGIT